MCVHGANVFMDPVFHIRIPILARLNPPTQHSDVRSRCRVRSDYGKTKHRGCAPGAPARHTRCVPRSALLCHHCPDCFSPQGFLIALIAPLSEKSHCPLPVFANSQSLFSGGEFPCDLWPAGFSGSPPDLDTPQLLPASPPTPVAAWASPVPQSTPARASPTPSTPALGSTAGVP